MSAEDIITSIVLGFVGGLLIFTAIVVSRRGKPWSLPPPRHAEDRSDDGKRPADHTSRTRCDWHGFALRVGTVAVVTIQAATASVDSPGSSSAIRACFQPEASF